MSIFDTSSLIAPDSEPPEPSDIHPNVSGTTTEQAQLTYGIFYTSGTTFAGNYGVFVSSIGVPPME